jgi:hypothetical protein
VAEEAVALKGEVIVLAIAFEALAKRDVDAKQYVAVTSAGVLYSFGLPE